MKKILSLCILLLILRNAFCQNLVPNGDFETYSQLPQGAGYYYYANGWDNCGGFGSPDYFHINGNGAAQLPNAFPATVMPHTGSAIMGFGLYDIGYPDFREYLSRQLLLPLVIGQSYQLSFYVTNGTPPINYGGSGIDHFSVAFSTTPLVQSSPLIINFTPQYIYSGFLYNNNWQQVTFNFTADSAYQYITFGSFVDDLTQQLQPYDSALSFSEAYYFLDDINLEITTGITYYNNNENRISVSPTLFSEKLYIKSDASASYEVILYSVSLEKLVHAKFNSSITMNTAQLAKGIYFYEVRNNSGVIKKGKVVKE